MSQSRHSARERGYTIMHAFIIEDDYLIAQSLCDLLEPLGFTSFSFARSEDAAIVGAREQRKIDLITADVRLLPGDGVKAVEEICKRRRAPVVFITGYAQDVLMRVPGATVIQKPVQQDPLATAVQEVVRKLPQRRTHSKAE